jgi:hypothetical protein
MTNLIERYIHQVVRFLPPKDRAEIEAELRSLIQDQLEDRSPGAPSEAQVAAVLAELGDPQKMAASYSRNQYLVGPDLYPTLMIVLRYVWQIVPAAIACLHIIGALASSQPSAVPTLVFETLIAALQAGVIATAIVVLLFAMIQRSGTPLVEPQAFNPLELPEVDDPRRVDRLEAGFGIVIGAVITLIALYFMRVGGLTLRFTLGDPGNVIPVSSGWLLVVAIATFAMVIIQLVALRRNRWSIGLWLMQTGAEIVSMVGLYFVLLKPLAERAVTTIPTLANSSLVSNAPEIIVGSYAVITLTSSGIKLFKLWNYRKDRALPYSAKVTG